MRKFLVLMGITLACILLMGCPLATVIVVGFILHSAFNTSALVSCVISFIVVYGLILLSIKLMMIDDGE